MEFLANQLVDFQTVNYGKTGSYESRETRLLGENCTSGANNLLVFVKHLGLMVLVCHCHVTLLAGFFVT